MGYGNGGRGSDGAPRVACALAGELRTLSRLRHRFVEDVKKPLQADIFAHVSSGSTTRPWKLRHCHSFINASVSVHAVLAIKQILEPVSFVVDSGLDYLEDSAVYVNDTLAALTAFGLLTRWERLLEAILTHERATQLAYNWVIRMRPDLLFSCRLTPLFLADLGPRSAQQADSFTIMDRRTATHVLRARSILASCSCRIGIEFCVPSLLLAANVTFVEVEISDILRTVSCAAAVAPNGCSTADAGGCNSPTMEANANTTETGKPLCRLSALRHQEVSWTAFAHQVHARAEWISSTPFASPSLRTFAWDNSVSRDSMIARAGYALCPPKQLEAELTVNSPG